MGWDWVENYGFPTSHTGNPFVFNTFNVPICLKLIPYLLHENYSDCSPKVML